MVFGRKKEFKIGEGFGYREPASKRILTGFKVYGGALKKAYLSGAGRTPEARKSRIENLDLELAQLSREEKVALKKYRIRKAKERIRKLDEGSSGGFLMDVPDVLGSFGMPKKSKGGFSI